MHFRRKKYEISLNIFKNQRNIFFKKMGHWSSFVEISYYAMQSGVVSFLHWIRDTPCANVCIFAYFDACGRDSVFVLTNAKKLNEPTQIALPCDWCLFFVCVFELWLKTSAESHFMRIPRHMKFGNIWALNATAPISDKCYFYTTKLLNLK